MAYLFQRRLLASVHERGETLFALASGGLLARFPWVRLADSDLVVVPVSVIANVADGLGTVAIVIEFVLLYVIYTSIAPSLIPEQAVPDQKVDDEGSDSADRPLGDRPWFRRLVATGSLGYAFLLYYYVFAGVDSNWAPGWFLVSVGWSAVSVAALTLYLHRTTGELEPGHPAVELIDAVTPFEDATDPLRKVLALSGPQKRIELATWWLAAGFLLVVPTFLLGLVGGTLSGYFPLLEGLVVGWFVASKAATLLPAAPGSGLPDRKRVDVDFRLFAAIGSAFSSIKGAILTMFAFLGVTVTAGAFALGVGLTPEAIELVDVYLAGLGTPGFPVVYATAVLLEGVSGVLAALVVGTYGLWYWLRALRRLPSYLAWWQDARGVKPGTTETGPLSDVPALPPGYMLPPSVLVTLAFDWASPSPTLASNRGEYLLLWGLAFAATLWTVSHAVRRPSQPPRSDGLAVPLAVGVQLSGFFVGGLFAGTTEPAVVAFLWLVLLMAYYLPDVFAVARRHEEDWLQFGHAGYLFLWAGVFESLSLISANGVSWVARPVAAVAATCAVALAFARIWDERFHRE